MKRSFAALLLGLGACAAHPPSSLPSPGGGIAFALIGDTPYGGFEARALDSMIEEMNREDLAFVIHVGDITSGRGPCGDEWFEARKRQFGKSRHPFILIPGDNDWVDCHRTGFDPLERLGRFREIFESGDRSLGERGLRLERQSGRYSDYREHLRWISADVLFLGVNVPGGNNNLGRTPAMDAEHRSRMAAVRAWLDEGERLAGERRLSGMVIFAQGDPRFETAGRCTGADGFAEFRAALRDLALRFGKPVLFVNGDTHFHRIDEPLSDPATGRPLPNFTRVVVYGSPFTHWIRADIAPSSERLFRVNPAPDR
ncbi:MAG: metallophosphoesterase family protein [Burkholderiales bacterium]